VQFFLVGGWGDSRPRNSPILPSVFQRHRSSFQRSAPAEAVMTRSLFQIPWIGRSSLYEDCRSLMKRILLLVPCLSGSPCSGSYSILSTRLRARIFSCTRSGDSFGYIPIGPLLLNYSHARDVTQSFPQGCTLGSSALQKVEISLGLSRSTSMLKSHWRIMTLGGIYWDHGFHSFSSILRLNS
jgi:hypothetical protein